jgi:predicted transcriptional regulator YdeE
MRKMLLGMLTGVTVGCATVRTAQEGSVEPTMVDRAAFTLIGIQTWIDPETADHEAIFDRQYRPHEAKARAVASTPGLYGAYFASRGPGKVGYMVGVAAKEGTTPPEGLVALAIPAARYAVFEFPRSDIGKTWHHIHGEWLPKSREFALASSPVFEYFPKSNTTETRLAIWIPVKPKE